MVKALVVESTKGIVVYGVGVEVWIPHNHILHNGVLVGIGLCIIGLSLWVSSQSRCSSQKRAGFIRKDQ